LKSRLLASGQIQALKEKALILKSRQIYCATKEQEKISNCRLSKRKKKSAKLKKGGLVGRIIRLLQDYTVSGFYNCYCCMPLDLFLAQINKIKETYCKKKDVSMMMINENKLNSIGYRKICLRSLFGTHSG